MELEHEDLTGKIIGAAIEVHRHLGPGFVESIYENALIVELRHREIAFARQLSVPIVYRDVEVGLHREHGLILNFTQPKLEIKRVIAPPPMA